MKKILTFGIMLMFLLMTISSANETYMEKPSIKPVSFGNTLYVGGNGTGNYSSIQDAIDDSENGDTVYVYDDSSPYYETNITIDKSISLIGENKETTIIEGNDDVLTIIADYVTVNDFTIQNYKSRNGYGFYLIFIRHSNYSVISGNIFKGNLSSGIYVNGADYNIISNNVFTSELSLAIIIDFSKYNEIFNNYISTGGSGIWMDYSYYNKIFWNTITDCRDTGIILWATENNRIYENNITYNPTGIDAMGYCINDTIYRNNILYSDYIGFFGWNCFDCKITENNFIGNDKNAYFSYLFSGLWMVLLFATSLPDNLRLMFDGNYWDDIKYQYYIINGFISLIRLNHRLRGSGILYSKRGQIGNWIHLDKNPALEPYDIEV